MARTNQIIKAKKFENVVEVVDIIFNDEVEVEEKEEKEVEEVEEEKEEKEVEEKNKLLVKLVKMAVKKAKKSDDEVVKKVKKSDDEKIEKPKRTRKPSVYNMLIGEFMKKIALEENDKDKESQIPRNERMKAAQTMYKEWKRAREVLNS
jgi:hypothetical protein